MNKEGLFVVGGAFATFLAAVWAGVATGAAQATQLPVGYFF